MIGKITMWKMSEINDDVFECKTRAETNLLVALAEYLREIDANSENIGLYMRLLQTNREEVVNALVKSKNESSIFSKVELNSEHTRIALRILASIFPEEIYEPVLNSLLSIFETLYYSPVYGFNVYPLTIMDINQIAKYLTRDSDQDAPVSRSLLKFLENIHQCVELGSNKEFHAVQVHAGRISLAYLDKSKHIEDIIPHALISMPESVRKNKTRIIKK